MSSIAAKRSGIEFVPRLAVIPESNGFDADKGSGGRDMKKGAGGSAVMPRRRWRTLLGVRPKTLFLFLLLLGLQQMVWGLFPNSADNSLKIARMASDFDVRIAALDALLKEAPKMLQLQVGDFVDKKFSNEIGGLTQEFNKEIEENRVEFANTVRRLDSRSEALENAVKEIKSMDILTKEGREKFHNELKLLVGDVVDKKLITSVKMVVDKEIERHAADGVGMVDYALASAGGRVVMHSKPMITAQGAASFYLKKLKASMGVHSEAVKMLTPSFGEPGQCFPLKGSTGFVQIRLRTAIVPQGVTLEHVSKSVAYDRSSAPKECRISGWMEGPNPKSTDSPDGKTLLVEFTYDLERSNAQTFKVADSGDLGPVDVIQLDVASNHGNPDHTCIYRLRVHGYEPP